MRLKAGDQRFLGIGLVLEGGVGHELSLWWVGNTSIFWGGNFGDWAVWGLALGTGSVFQGFALLSIKRLFWTMVPRIAIIQVTRDSEIPSAGGR